MHVEQLKQFRLTVTGAELFLICRALAGLDLSDQITKQRIAAGEHDYREHLKLKTNVDKAAANHDDETQYPGAVANGGAGVAKAPIYVRRRPSAQEDQG